jgi:hypothetical protein
MNIKAILEQGYSQKEYINFITEYNRKQGCIIEFKDDKVVALEKTDEEKAKEKENLINHLTCTALDLITFIKSLGLTDEAILVYLQANPSLQLQLTFCKDVYCGVVRQLCPIKISEELIITDEQIVKFFKDKNKIV